MIDQYFFQKATVLPNSLPVPEALRVTRFSAEELACGCVCPAQLKTQEPIAELMEHLPVEHILLRMPNNYGWCLVIFGTHRHYQTLPILGDSKSTKQHCFSLRPPAGHGVYHPFDVWSSPISKSGT